MRLVILLFGLALGTLADAAGLAGTYVLDGPGGQLVVRFEQVGSTLHGSLETEGRNVVDFAGMASGTKAHGAATSKDGSGTFEASVDGDTLNLVLAQPAGPGQKAATLPLQLRREAAPGSGSKPLTDLGGDPRLVGDWVSEDVITSGTASMATEEYLAFRADGAYAYGKGRSVASGADWSYDGGVDKGMERGRWRAKDSVLFLVAPTGQWTRVGRYGMTDDGRALRITYDRGGRKLWTRR